VFVVVAIADCSSGVGIISALEAVGAALSSSPDPRVLSAVGSGTEDGVATVGTFASIAALEVVSYSGSWGVAKRSTID